MTEFYTFLECRKCPANCLAINEKYKQEISENCGLKPSQLDWVKRDDPK